MTRIFYLSSTIINWHRLSSTDINCHQLSSIAKYWALSFSTDKRDSTRVSNMQSSEGETSDSLTGGACSLGEKKKLKRDKGKGLKKSKTASSSITETPEFLSCQICYEQYTSALKPWTAGCGHLCCRPCLDRLLNAVRHRPEDSLPSDTPLGSVKCPSCRQPNKVSSYIKLNLSSTCTVASDERKEVVHLLKRLKSDKLVSVLSCLSEWEIEDRASLVTVPKIVNSNQLGNGHLLRGFTKNQQIKSRLSKIHFAKDNIGDAILYLDNIVKTISQDISDRPSSSSQVPSTEARRRRSLNEPIVWWNG